LACWQGDGYCHVEANQREARTFTACTPITYTAFSTFSTYPAFSAVTQCV
jgi:hypothetical protein